MQANPDRQRDGDIAREALELPGGAGEMVSNLLPGARLVGTFSTIEAHVLARGALTDSDTRVFHSGMTAPEIAAALRTK